MILESSLDVDRKQIFSKNLREVIDHNKKDGITFKKGINPYSDLTEDEFLDYFTLKDA